jgi:SulP family sulfate permease
MVVNGSLSKTAVNGSAGARTQLSGLFVAVMTIITLLFLTGLFEDLPEATLGLFIGIAVSLLLLLYRASKPHVAELGRVPGAADQFADRERHPENAAMPGIVIVRVESGLFFANADAVRDALRADAARPGTHAVVIDAESIAFVDVTAVRMLDELAQTMADADVTLAIAHDIGQVRDLLASGDHTVAALRVFRTVQDAVVAFDGST